MYFSVMTLKQEAFVASLGLAIAEGAWGVHKLIWSFFPGKTNGTPCPLHRFDAKPTPGFHVVSKDKPRDTLGCWDIRSREYDPKLAAADRLAFMVRVNPVVTRRDENGKHKRHDVVMDAKKALRDAGKTKEEWPPPAELWREAVLGWLRARCAKHGFDFREEDIRVDGYMPTRIWRAKQKEPVHITTVDINGFLAVTDPALFRKVLFEGLGPAKGFGCGLMLVKRATS